MIGNHYPDRQRTREIARFKEPHKPHERRGKYSPLGRGTELQQSRSVKTRARLRPERTSARRNTRYARAAHPPSGESVAAHLIREKWTRARKETRKRASQSGCTIHTHIHAHARMHARTPVTACVSSTLRPGWRTVRVITAICEGWRERGGEHRMTATHYASA